MPRNIHRVDNHIVKLTEDNMGKSEIWLNDRVIHTEITEAEELEKHMSIIVEALKAGGYEYEEFVHEQENWEEEGISQYCLTRIFENGDIEDLEFGDDKVELKELVKQD